MNEPRKAEIRRATNETAIDLSINLEGRGKGTITTGVPFMDHMLNSFCKHGMIDLVVQAEGDVEIDDHHTVEDLGIVLGQALQRALGDKRGIRRFGDAVVPMDEALAQVTLDLSGRGYLVYRVAVSPERIGTFDPALVREFMYALAVNAGINLHINLHYGDNAHHCVEAIFKALGRALRQAAEDDPQNQGIPSTKGTL